MASPPLWGSTVRLVVAAVAVVGGGGVVVVLLVGEEGGSVSAPGPPGLTVVLGGVASSAPSCREGGDGEGPSSAHSTSLSWQSPIPGETWQSRNSTLHSARLASSSSPSLALDSGTSERPQEVVRASHWPLASSPLRQAMASTQRRISSREDSSAKGRFSTNSMSRVLTEDKMDFFLLNHHFSINFLILSHLNVAGMSFSPPGTWSSRSASQSNTGCPRTLPPTP